jgi:Pyridine nucleotide-disulphide oxidoreductase
MLETADTSAGRLENCDVCIVGAGITGLNALFVASQYLSRDQRVILVDRRQRVGGMWVDTYPYVRLHQPHPMFTAGNIAWTLGKEPAYLATKNEVLDHFEHCLNVIKQQVSVTEYYGWSVESNEETPRGVRVNCTSSDGQALTIEAKRLINAQGFRIVPNDPLEISSARVQSVSPDFCDMRSGDIAESDAPVWIIGGGKTAMDTAHALISRCPGREVNLVAGSGTYFGSRDRLFPRGARRWWAGTAVSTIARQTAQRFDGTNETDVAEWFRAQYGTWLTPTAKNYLLGMLSEAENETIGTGLNQVVMDHFVDAVDGDGATRLMFRSGATKQVPPGSWIVNCTGYVSRIDQDYEPYASDSGAVLSIQVRSAVLHLSSYAGYFLTHLLFLGALRDAGLYELDLQELLNKSKAVTPFALFSLVQHNISIISDCVPAKVFRDCGLDFDLWYPLPRRLVATVPFLLLHHREREHHRRCLDTLRERFDVRSGPLPSRVTPVAAPLPGRS